MVLNLVFIFLLAPLFAWGLTSQNILRYQKQAQEKALWQDPQWIKLGHYRKNLFGGYKSPLLGNFFVSENGSEDPKAELFATIELLFNKDTAQKSQCRYLARTSWLKNVLAVDSSDLVSCSERDQWKTQLGAQEIYIIFAASDLSSAGSSFGHTFLRVHNPKNTRELELLDYGINYAAVTGKDTGALYALKGLFGFYPGAYSMLPYYQKIREYTNLEGRNLWEYRLDLSPEQVTFLIDHLLELDGSFAPYYFADDNCSQQILELIEVAKPELNASASFYDVTIPIDTVKELKKHNMLVGEKLRLSLQAEWQTRFTSLNYSQKKALKEIVYAKTQTDLQKLSTKEQAEALEAILSYLAIKEYREEKDLKEEKYPLSVARAKLGPQTEPLQIPNPPSPLFGANSYAFYLGYGKADENEFYRFKYRRTFHDLLSDDSGLSTFSHLEVLSADFRYFSEKQNLDLYQAVLVKILSTSPITELDTPLTWTVDIGTEPRLSPYVNLGAGYSFDFPLFKATRFSFMAVTENYDLADTAQPHFGVEGLLMSKTSFVRSLIYTKYLHNTSQGRGFSEYGIGLSTDVRKSELRLESKVRDNIPEWMISVVF
ncbi:Lnb N-terminal periplasmic domain-containing protein [Bdellovibrio sp. BCCA]|uniref:Lnb N-terminal periplasmic domain-containing protein n=1 Tax=Bdellovibrio sp. BCCA TaxID=3136281 RepID=UPI0030F1C1B9